MIKDSRKIPLWEKIRKPRKKCRYSNRYCYRTYIKYADSKDLLLHCPSLWYSGNLNSVYLHLTSSSWILSIILFFCFCNKVFSVNKLFMYIYVQCTFNCLYTVQSIARLETWAFKEWGFSLWFLRTEQPCFLQWLFRCWESPFQFMPLCTVHIDSWLKGRGTPNSASDSIL